MDAKLFGEVLFQSVELIGEKPDQKEHIAKEFGLERSVMFVTNVYTEFLPEILAGAKDLYSLNCEITPVKKINRTVIPGEKVATTDPEFIKYLREQTGLAINRAFSHLTNPQRMILQRNYDSRFKLYLRKEFSDNTEFLRSTSKLIKYLCDNDVSFSMPSAVGSNHYGHSNIFYPFYDQTSPRHAPPTYPLIISSDQYRPFTAPRLVYGINDTAVQVTPHRPKKEK